MIFRKLFPTLKPIIGMVHLLPLPETPHFAGDINIISQLAIEDTKTLLDAGIDALIIENFGDEPYLIGEPTPMQVALMARVTTQIRQMTEKPIGINVQFNAWQAELALAYACHAQFIRVEGIDKLSAENDR